MYGMAICTSESGRAFVCYTDDSRAKTRAAKGAAINPSRGERPHTAEKIIDFPVGLKGQLGKNFCRSVVKMDTRGTGPITDPHLHEQETVEALYSKDQTINAVFQRSTENRYQRALKGERRLIDTVR